MARKLTPFDPKPYRPGSAVTLDGRDYFIMAPGPVAASSWAHEIETGAWKALKHPTTKRGAYVIPAEQPAQDYATVAMARHRRALAVQKGYATVTRSTRQVRSLFGSGSYRAQVSETFTVHASPACEFAQDVEPAPAYPLAHLAAQIVHELPDGRASQRHLCPCITDPAGVALLKGNAA